ncbi:dienelactone hydrolase family protein [Clostridium estertheticum]|uniref:carboxylesterase family protein n=1 Tax=Clostridium estertheticum TaxID=238834 RepID=UPI001CF57C57|nr:dienelactone hydrolase family protein [Clostridium estertheticum]MCB2307333.1 dienelactone hydrolase family protein [Clostridium estertheticum]MCB2344983.1 dienelactone hydrolase family protein [Clostridium estertheticum]MCB2349855.1 dienelactone hydrolase family protein [Clostridium estertheticum]WAG48219.1 dienelactone hydrolase family protein [Clostridium estertheticum]
MGFQSFKFEKDTELKLNYMVYLPLSYNTIKKFPLILSLHGSGERGNNIDTVKKWGINKILRENDNFPFVVVSPQCPIGEIWEMQFNVLKALLDETENNYNIDNERIYLTGYSLGGYGTWNFAILNPERFSAIVPISGGSISPQKSFNLRNLPIWVAHGDSDTVVKFEESERIVDYLKKYNPNIIFKVYKGAGHEVCTTAYEEPELFQCLLKQKIKI